MCDNRIKIPKLALETLLIKKPQCMNWFVKWEGAFEYGICNIE